MNHAQKGVLCLDYELIQYDKMKFCVGEYDNMKCGVGVVLPWGVTPWSLSWVGAIMGYDTIMSVAGGSNVLEEHNASIFYYGENYEFCMLNCFTECQYLIFISTFCNLHYV